MEGISEGLMEGISEGLMEGWSADTVVGSSSSRRRSAAAAVILMVENAVFIIISCSFTWIVRSTSALQIRHHVDSVSCWFRMKM
jgi:hypothetical protein